MDKEKFYRLLKNPLNADDRDQKELEELIRKYPFFQSVKLLLALAQTTTDHVKQAAIAIYDRNLLKKLIEVKINPNKKKSLLSDDIKVYFLNIETEITENEISEPLNIETEITENEISEPLNPETEITENEISEPLNIETEITESKISEPLNIETEITESKISEPLNIETEITESKISEPLNSEIETTEDNIELSNSEIEKNNEGQENLLENITGLTNNEDDMGDSLEQQEKPDEKLFEDEQLSNNLTSYEKSSVEFQNTSGLKTQELDQKIDDKANPTDYFDQLSDNFALGIDITNELGVDITNEEQTQEIMIANFIDNYHPKQNNFKDDSKTTTSEDLASLDLDMTRYSSESLAEIMVNQKKYKKAISIYEVLSIKKPKLKLKYQKEITSLEQLINIS